MQIDSLKRKFDALQKKHGDPSLRAIYGAGCVDHPRVCFVFMNPTARNVASKKSWKGLRAPWIGTKQAWQLLTELGCFDKKLNRHVQAMRPEAWTPAFAEEVYGEIVKRGFYITNLAKCTQCDARPLPDDVFRRYLPLLHDEIRQINPSVIISFGNQVSSVLLERSISVSKCRRAVVPLTVGEQTVDVYPVYYPVGQGTPNIGKAKTDVTWILQKSRLG